jgi:hypothetical protein
MPKQYPQEILRVIFFRPINTKILRSHICPGKEYRFWRKHAISAHRDKQALQLCVYGKPYLKVRLANVKKSLEKMKS